MNKKKVVVISKRVKSTLEIVKTETMDTTNKKSLEDYDFKPKEWCLMQTIYFPQFSTKSANNPWTLCQFSHKYGSNYVAVGGNKYHHCIPYNDNTAHLLGTTDDWKGGKK